MLLTDVASGFTDLSKIFWTGALSSIGRVLDESSRVNWISFFNKKKMIED